MHLTFFSLLSVLHRPTPPLPTGRWHPQYARSAARTHPPEILPTPPLCEGHLSPAPAFRLTSYHAHKLHQTSCSFGGLRLGCQHKHIQGESYRPPPYRTHMCQFTLLHARVLQKHPSEPEISLSINLSEQPLHRTLQQDGLTTHIPANGGKPHGYSFVHAKLFATSTATSQSQLMGWEQTSPKSLRYESNRRQAFTA